MTARHSTDSDGCGKRHGAKTLVMVSEVVLVFVLSCGRSNRRDAILKSGTLVSLFDCEQLAKQHSRIKDFSPRVNLEIMRCLCALVLAGTKQHRLSTVDGRKS